jgi:hypothetical protein
MSAQQALEQALSSSQRARRWVRGSRRQLRHLGFERDNTYAATGLCRDELCTPFEQAVDRTWGESFNCTSLAGVPTLGTTGFQTLARHAPSQDGKARFVLYFLAHIGVDSAGTVGLCDRGHRHGPACGALARILGELQRGDLNPKMDGHDPEFSLLRFRLSRALGKQKVNDLLTLTRYTLLATQQDVRRLIGELPHSADIALLTGILVHLPDEDRVIPADCSARVDGRVVPLP